MSEDWPTRSAPTGEDAVSVATKCRLPRRHAVLSSGLSQAIEAATVRPTERERLTMATRQLPSWGTRKRRMARLRTKTRSYRASSRLVYVYKRRTEERR